MLAACSRAPGDFAECPDAACRQFLVVEAWNGGPESVGHLLVQVEDEVELTVIMNRLRETYPDETTGLCDFLPEGLTRQRCHRIHSRPHLEGETRAALPIVKLEHPGGGPSTRGRLRRTRSRFSWVTPVESECPQGGARNACVQREAVAFSGQGESKRAGALCANLPTGEPRHQCMVAAAQAWTGQARDVSETEGLDLCLAAGDKAYDCLGDMIAHLVEGAVTGGADSWPALVESAGSFHESWVEWDSGFADLLVERFWSIAAMGALQSNGAPTSPGPLPEVALVQLRCAVALHRLGASEGSRLSLEAWVEQITAAMDQLPPPRAPGGASRVVDFWPSDREGDTARAAVVYQDASRRTRGGSEKADLAICVLEAAARVAPRRDALLREGQDHSDGAVRWTAERLIRGLDGGYEEGDQPWGADHWSDLPQDEATHDREDPRARGPDPVPGGGG